MGMRDRLKRWWQIRTGEEETPFDGGDTPAWLISLIVHMGLLIILTLVLRDIPREDEGHVEYTCRLVAHLGLGI